VHSDAVEDDGVEYHYVRNQRKRFIRCQKKMGYRKSSLPRKKDRSITAELYQQLLRLLSRADHREYTQVYESKTHRIPEHYIARDFYRFSRSAEAITINCICSWCGFSRS
jgi:hypothetical protein